MNIESPHVTLPGHGRAVCRRARGHAPDLRALRVISDAVEELVHRADYESFERYVHLNERFHARLLKIARSPLLERALEGIVSLPFAGPSAFVLTEAELPSPATSC